MKKTKRNSKKTKRSYIKKTKRSQSKYPALDKSVNLRTRIHLIDYDYLDKLSPEEKQWLNKFTDEYVNGNFNRENTRSNLQKGRAPIKDSDDRNNARNRDVMTRQQARKSTVYLEDIKLKTQNPENQIHARIELKRLGILDENGNRKRKKRNSKYTIED